MNVVTFLDDGCLSALGSTVPVLVYIFLCLLYVIKWYKNVLSHSEPFMHFDLMMQVTFTSSNYNLDPFFSFVDVGLVPLLLKWA